MLLDPVRCASARASYRWQRERLFTRLTTLEEFIRADDSFDLVERSPFGLGAANADR